MFRGLYFTVVFALVGLIIMATPLLAEDSYFLYGKWDYTELVPPLPDSLKYLTGINGYVDVTGGALGTAGAEYIFFTGGPAYGGTHIAYIYRVETEGDPDDTLTIGKRTFTFVDSHYLGYYASGHDNAFYVDRTGIYYGASNNATGGVDGWGMVMGGGIFHWDFQWNLLGCVVPDPCPPFNPMGAQTLARNPATGHWWVGSAVRDLYRWNSSTSLWDHQYTYPRLSNLPGDHHDGLEIVGNFMYISDMKSDTILRYELDASGNLDDPDNNWKKFTYTAGPWVEGMGYGPNKHFWISGWDYYCIYEIGGGGLVPPIPTLTEWGLIIFGVVLIGFITYVFLRRRKTVVSVQ